MPRRRPRRTTSIFEYSNDPDATKQAQLIQAAIDKKVDGIAVTDPNTGALGETIKKAVAAGIPVTMFNAGGPDALGLGVLGYFGQGEKEAGIGAGKKIVDEGGKYILCVIQEQGQQQLEDRCDGVTEGAAGAKVERLYVNGRDDSRGDDIDPGQADPGQGRRLGARPRCPLRSRRGEVG